MPAIDQPQLLQGKNIVQETRSAATTLHSTSYNGAHREFWLHRPACIDVGAKRRWPLVMMLHGFGERGAEYAGLEGPWSDRWTEESDRSCFYVVWPQGLSEPMKRGGEKTSWNDLTCSSAGTEYCEPAVLGESYCMTRTCTSSCGPCGWCNCGDDLGFVEGLTRTLARSDLRLDASRLFAAGSSNGGMIG